MFVNGFLIQTDISLEVTLLLREHYFGCGVAWAKDITKINKKFTKYD